MPSNRKLLMMNGGTHNSSCCRYFVWNTFLAGSDGVLAWQASHMMRISDLSSIKLNFKPLKGKHSSKKMAAHIKGTF